MTERVNVAPELITWARSRAGLGQVDLARKLNIKPETLKEWEAGNSSPTFKQVQNIAQHTYIPFGFLFLKYPPQNDHLPIPDLRTKGDKIPEHTSLNLLDTVKDVMFRQQWYEEHQVEQGASKVEVVGKASHWRDDVSRIVAAMKKSLGISSKPSWGNWDDYMRTLITNIEATGVLVMRNSMVGSNSRRILDVNEFRGFALSSQYAPVIFINTADCPEARLFTLIHELAHIWIGESGISDGDLSSESKTERLCNTISAEFLTPKDEFLERWDDTESDWVTNVARLSTYFHVSKWVIARRALELSLIRAEEYWDYVSKLKAFYDNNNSKGAPSYYRLQTQRVSSKLAIAVVTEALSGNMLLRDAGNLASTRGVFTELEGFGDGLSECKSTPRQFKNIENLSMLRLALFPVCPPRSQAEYRRISSILHAWLPSR